MFDPLHLLEKLLMNENMDNVMAKLKGSFGKGSIELTKLNKERVPWWVSTGSPLLDAAIKNGVPGGVIVEVTGKSATGKSALCYEILRQTQLAGGVGVLIDGENAANISFAKLLNVDVDNLPVVNVYCLEEIYDSAKQIIKDVRHEIPDTTVPLVIVADSCTLPPQEDLAKVHTDDRAKIGEAAKSHRRGLRSLTEILRRQGATFIGINHLTNNIATGPGSMYAPKLISSGGTAWEFYPSLELRITSHAIRTDDKKKQLGLSMFVETVKTRYSSPNKTALLELDFKEGFRNTMPIVNYAIECGLIQSQGAWYTYKQEKYHGRARLAELFDNNPEEMEELITDCKAVMLAG